MIKSQEEEREELKIIIKNYQEKIKSLKIRMTKTKGCIETYTEVIETLKEILDVN